jgi:6-phosphogluconate dehydrogenase
MELGVIGLGRMGQIVVDRVLEAGHSVVAFDIDEESVKAAREAGAVAADSIEELVEKLDSPYVWLMVPAGDAVDQAISEVDPLLGSDGIIIDAGNSHFESTMDRSNACEATFLDCGTSGGPVAAEHGFSLMIGGPKSAYEKLTPVFDAVATGPLGHERVGPVGAGHYVKMIHNGIEYALMQSYGEGFELLANGRFDIDLHLVARTWNHGAVVRSWLLELIEEAFEEEGNDLGDVADFVAGGSAGQWTVEEALEQGVPVPLMYGALAERFSSRQDRFSRRLSNRLRYGFGRHEVVRD